MNVKQTFVLVIMLLALVTMVLFPPWINTESYPNMDTVTWPAGFHPVFDPPSVFRSAPAYGVRIASIQLLIQCGVAMVCGASLILAFRSKTKK